VAGGEDAQAASRENPANKPGKRRLNRTRRNCSQSKVRTRQEYPILKSIPKQMAQTC